MISLTNMKNMNKYFCILHTIFLFLKQKPKFIFVSDKNKFKILYSNKKLLNVN